MEDQQGQGQGQGQDPPNCPTEKATTAEPVRSRWTPRPEQILILESIFNSGMVNPPKDETVRIRKLLEKFGSVGDANVFYWFQNRRSRSRRRQRQMQQQNLDQRNNQLNNQPQQLGRAGAIPYAHPQIQNNSAPAMVGFGTAGGSSSVADSSSSFLPGPVVSGEESMEGFFSSVSHQMGFPEIDHSTSAATSVLYPPNLNYHSGFGGTNNIPGFITVFINGVATEVPRGPMDIKAVFGQDAMLLHSSGVPLPINEFGFLMQSLEHGESYFLVSKPTQV